MISNVPHLFVYSSLLRGFQQGSHEYISRYFTFISDAKVKGILSDLGDKPVATPTNENRFIKGELYKLNVDDASFVFGQLDDYEGLHPEEGQIALFRREVAMIYGDNGSNIPAWVYWYNGDVSGKPIVESGDVMEYAKSKFS